MTTAKGTQLMLLWDRSACSLKARSSVGEHYLDAVGVSGSIPLVPTNLKYQRLFIRQPGDLGYFLRDYAAKQNEFFLLASVIDCDS